MCYKDLQSVHASHTKGGCRPQTAVPGSQDGFAETQNDHIVQHVISYRECPNDLAHWTMMHSHRCTLHELQLAFSTSAYHD